MTSSRLLRLARLPHPSISSAPINNQKIAAQSMVKHQREFRATSNISSSAQVEDSTKPPDTNLSDEELRLVNKLSKSFPGGQIAVQDVSGPDALPCLFFFSSLPKV